MNLRLLALTLALPLALPACKKEEAAPKPSAPADGKNTVAAKDTAAGKDTAEAKKPPAPAGDLKLTYAPDKVGDKRTETETVTTALKIEAQPGNMIDMVEKKTTVETIEVLKVDGDIMSEAKLTYGESKSSKDMAGKMKEEPALFSGKTYVITREGEGILVALEDGTAAPLNETAAVHKDKKRFGRKDGDAMEKIISGRTWKVGEKVDLTADEVKSLGASMGSGGDDPSLVSMSFTLKGVEGDVATFEMTMVMDVKSADGGMKINLAGTAKIDVKTSKPHELDFKGPIEGKMKGMAITGTMEAKTVYSK